MPPETLAPNTMLVPCRLTPPLAATAPDTVVPLLFVSVNEPAPSVTDVIEMGRDACAMFAMDALAPPPFVSVRASIEVLRLTVPLFVRTVSPLAPRPVDVISPLPVIDFAEPELVLSVTPPLAVRAADTEMVPGVTSENEPLFRLDAWMAAETVSVMAVEPEVALAVTVVAFVLEIVAPPVPEFKDNVPVERLVAPV